MAALDQDNAPQQPSTGSLSGSKSEQQVRAAVVSGIDTGGGKISTPKRAALGTISNVPGGRTARSSTDTKAAYPAAPAATA